MGNKKKITELQEYIQNLNFTCCRFQQSSFNKELKEQLDRKSAKASSPSSTDSTQPRFAEHSIQKQQNRHSFQATTEIIPRLDKTWTINQTSTKLKELKPYWLCLLTTIN